MTYAINAPDVIAETIDGETILVHLATGSYYSLEGAGAAVWEALMERRSPAAIAAALARRYDAPSSEIQPAVERLIGELQEEKLVVETGHSDVVAASSDEPEPGERLVFVAPGLQKFTDMQDIILLDPVHQVDHRGWPHPAEDVDLRAAG